MAKGDGKQFKSKPAGKQAILPGGSGKMQKFKPVKPQKAGITSVD